MSSIITYVKFTIPTGVLHPGSDPDFDAYNKKGAEIIAKYMDVAQEQIVTEEFDDRSEMTFIRGPFTIENFTNLMTESAELRDQRKVDHETSSGIVRSIKIVDNDTQAVLADWEVIPSTFGQSYIDWFAAKIASLNLS